QMGLDQTREGERMAFCRVPYHGEHYIGVLDVDPAIGHRTPTERGGQTGHRGAVSYSRLTVAVDDSQRLHDFVLEPVELVGVGATADDRDPGRAVDHLPPRVPRDERPIAGVLDVPGDLADRLVPGDVLPLVGARTAHLRDGDPVGVVDVVPERGALRAQSSAIGRVIRIPFDMDHCRGDVLRLVPQGVDDGPATHGAVGAHA